VTHWLEARDGARIAWHVHLGRSASEAELAGRPAVLLTNGVGTSENFWKHIVEALEVDYRVVHWDYRGHGMSEPSKYGDYSVQAHVDDMTRVLEAVGETPVVQVAFSMGVPILLELFRRHPEKVPAAALIAGAPDAPGAGTFPWSLPGTRAAVKRLLDAVSPAVPRLAPRVRRLLRSSVPYPLGRALGVLRARAPRDEIEQMMEGLDPVAFFESVRALMRTDASDVLPRFKVPALIVAARNDKLMPIKQVRRMRDALPHAAYLEVEDAGHASLVEAGPEISAAVRAFVDRVRSP